MKSQYTGTAPDQILIPNMFVPAVQGDSSTDAIAFAVRALSDIGYSK